MTQTIAIQAIPNQSFSTTLDGKLFDITIKTTSGVTCVSIAIDGVQVISNGLAVAYGLIIPAKYLEAGNFMFVTQNYELPIYTQFGITQSLVYFTADELATYRVKPKKKITADFFNTAGGLPLRFKPQGYV